MMQTIGSAVRSFFVNDPARLMFLIRLVVYVALALITREALEPETLISLLAGVIGVDALTTETARSRTTPTATVDEVAAMSAYGQVGALAVEIVRAAASTSVPGVSLAQALSIVAPVVAPFAHQEITPTVQREVTAAIHQALRRAGLLRQVTLEGDAG